MPIGSRFGVPRVVEDDRDLLVTDARAGAEPAAPLLDDDAAFFLDFGRVQVQAAGEIGQRREPAGHDVALVGRQVEHVDSLVEARVGVHVRAEPGAQPLEVADEVSGLEVGAAVERHVLDEVREPLLVVRFLERSRLHGQPQRHTFFRAPVAADEVLEAVRQRPCPDGRVERQDGLRVDRRLGCWRLLRQQPRSDNRHQQREREDSRGGARESG